MEDLIEGPNHHGPTAGPSAEADAADLLAGNQLGEKLVDLLAVVAQDGERRRGHRAGGGEGGEGFR